MIGIEGERRRKKWDDNLRLEGKSYPHLDLIYRQYYQVAEKGIRRFDNPDDRRDMFFNRRLHIDTEVRMIDGSHLYVQEKVLRYWGADQYNDFTIEFLNDREKGLPGEYFEIAAGVYLHGYWNRDESGMYRWYLIDLVKFFPWFTRFKGEGYIRGHLANDRDSKASFVFIKYREIPPCCIIAAYDPQGEL